MFNNKKFEILFASASKNATFSSAIMEIEDMSMYALHAVWSGQIALAGNIKLEVSNDKTYWSDLTGSAQTFAGNGDFLWNVTSAGYRYVKVTATLTGGSATFYINGNSKGF